MGKTVRTTPTNSRSRLIEMARQNMSVIEAGELVKTAHVMQVPGSHYHDQARWDQEMARVFKRMPLMLAMSCELKAPGDFKTIEVCGVPVLIVRVEGGAVRAFINSCAHRGAVVMTEARGNSKRFTCPYHAWTYDHEGDLKSVYAEEDFGQIDKSCHGLTRLPTGERSGMIWVTLDPHSTLDIDTFLCGYDHLLAHFGFESWELFDDRTIDGPNWKIAYDGYMDLYHLPILHRKTFGANMPNQALYHAWGPHQRVSSPDPSLFKLKDKAEDQWPDRQLLSGVWTIFPHISIASFDGGGGRGVMISQLFPGDTPLQSRTIQNYLMQELPANEEVRESAHEQFSLLKYVVEEEDYATGLAQQRAIMHRPDAPVLFGRNEGGGQHFHSFLDRLLETEDRDLAALFNQITPET